MPSHASLRRVLLALMVTALGAAGVFALVIRPEHEFCGVEAEYAAAEEEGAGGEADKPCGINVPENETAELMRFSAQRTNVAAAPGRSVPPDAYANGARQAAAIKQAKAAVKEDANPWKPVGKGPLLANVEGYDGVNGLGLNELAGRPTGFAYDADHGRLLTSSSYGGVWSSNDLGGTWTSIGDGLPTQIVGSIGYIRADAKQPGTIVVITGDGSFGSDSLEGMGAFRSTDGGRTWQKATGVPDGAFGFAVAVDEARPGTVYAATGAGLYRSTDYGASFTDVKLPVGACAGLGNSTRACELANMVTDVVVQVPGGSSVAKGGTVLAAVGWRGGARRNPDGTVQSTGNGLYRSDSGAPGSFSKLDAPGFAPQDRIGRVELGIATGALQNHGYVYAMVQDAALLNDSVTGIDVDTGAEKPAADAVPTVFRGVYVSPDFGRTWLESTDAAALQSPTTGSALAVVAQGTGAYGPGVQAWYNEWIAPDPINQVGGVPTQLLFGLEEVWRNEQTNVPQTGPSSFRVVGRYFSGRTCLFLEPDAPCPTNREDALSETSTTHPDQQTAIWVPDKDGKGATLVVGNDGGVYTQHIGPDHPEIDNSHWGLGAQGGVDGQGEDRTLHTLLPYDAAVAKDGTYYMGLQDNGTAKITPEGTQIEGLGGDGFFVGVDPADSDKAYGEYTNGAMSGTTDGGKSWTGMSPPITDALFSTPFAVDPHDADHVMIAGRQVVETGSGTGTGADDWAAVFDLGTAAHRGDADATASRDDPANVMTALALEGSDAYVGFCGVCDVLNNSAPFRNGLATNVGGDRPSKRYTGDGWHFVAAQGLPNRYITNIAMDPSDHRTIWVTLGGYSRPWTHAQGSDAAGGHLYASHDGGATFTDMSGNLPDSIANWVLLRNGRPIVATDVGAFAMLPLKGANPAPSDVKFEALGTGLPSVRVMTLRPDPADGNRIIAATYGRGVYSYRFGAPAPPEEAPPAELHPEPFGSRVVDHVFGFETDEEGWTTKSGSDTMAWRRVAPGNASSASMQVIPYTDDATASLKSPKLTLPADSTVKVSWYAMRNTEDCCDFLAVDWSSDGYVWHNLYAEAGKNAAFPGFSAETPVDGAGQELKFVAPAGDLYVRFRVTADQLVSSPAYSGVALDDIKIER